MAAEDDKYALAEVEVFDHHTILFREGRATPQTLDSLLRESGLPADRQAALRKLLKTTDTLRTLGRALKARVVAALGDEPDQPVVVRAVDGG